MTTRTPWMPEQHRNKLRQAYWRKLAEDLEAWIKRRSVQRQERAMRALFPDVELKTYDPTLPIV